MSDRTVARLKDIVDAIDQIDILLAGSSLAELQIDRARRAAFERFLEILSEASRHIPAELKDQAPGTPWRRIGDIGNHLRHAYHRLDPEILWKLYEGGELSTLRQTILLFIKDMER